MTNSQFKKLKARNFNMARIETDAYRMDKILFPKTRPIRSGNSDLRCSPYFAVAMALSGGIGSVYK
jgi:hypothetical protein